MCRQKWAHSPPSDSAASVVVAAAATFFVVCPGYESGVGVTSKGRPSLPTGGFGVTVIVGTDINPTLMVDGITNKEAFVRARMHARTYARTQAHTHAHMNTYHMAEMA